MSVVERKRASDFPREVLDLFDKYVHGGIDRRAFLDEAAKNAWVSKDQIAALQRLDVALARHASNGGDAEDATRIQSPGWQQIRKLAKKTIEAFTTPAASA